MKSVVQHIRIERDPRLAVREGHDAIEYALMHPSTFPRHDIRRLEHALQIIKQVMEQR